MPPSRSALSLSWPGLHRYGQHQGSTWLSEDQFGSDRRKTGRGADVATSSLLTQSCQSESRRGMIGYCVVSAVEVEPRIMTLALANAKSMRFSAAKCIVPSRLLRRHGAAVVTADEVAPCTTRLESKSRRACGRAHLPMNLMICSATARGASSGI